MSEGLSKFEHLVVLMMENRSFDNVFGYLYGPEDGKTFEGVEGHDPPLSNPVPSYAAPSPEGGIVTVGKGEVMDNPIPDPGEEYPRINTQLFGGFNPPSNRGRGDYDNKDSSKNIQAPWNVPENPPATPPMSGFVQDYIDAYTLERGHAPTYDDYRVVMDCYPPEAIPVISTLARSFAVCDHWFSSLPSETYPNRTFFHAGTSQGRLLNSPFSFWTKQNDSETIFNRIEECQHRNLSWGIYYDPNDAVPLTLLLHYPKLKQFFGTHFHLMEEFYQHVKEGKLPNYAFVEPRLFLDQNSEHPPYKEAGVEMPSTVIAGEQLIYDVYAAIRDSDSSTGSNYKNTLFCITFDEHGGCYDHVPPPATVAPDPNAPEGQFGFKFDRLGVRVPTVFVSDWIQSGTVVNRTLEHCSILRTMCDKWGLPHLTERDRTAPHIGDIFTASEPRGRDAWPLPTPRKQTSKGTNRYSPLNHLQLCVAKTVGDLVEDSAPEFETVDHALRYMHEAFAKLKKQL